LPLYNLLVKFGIFLLDIPLNEPRHAVLGLLSRCGIGWTTAGLLFKSELAIFRTFMRITLV
jgi:hypothetical protein